MKRFIVIAVIVLSHLPVCSQVNCKNCVIDMYEQLFSDVDAAIKIGIENYPTAILRMNASKNSIMQAIEKTKVYIYGSPVDSILELNLQHETLFFCVSIELPSFRIESIYDSNGCNVLYSQDKLVFPAIINDNDGYVNIRKERNIKSGIVGNIQHGQIFFVTPTTKSNWWSVYTQDGGEMVGYIHRSRILLYEDCPDRIKKRMQKILFC